MAGLGIVNQLNNDIVTISQELGRKLAKSNFGLVTGGWPGVDEIVARAYSDEILKSHLPLEDYLTQIIVKTRFPTYTGGNLVLVERGDSEWIEPILASDALVLINGIGGTYETAKHAIKYNKPVYPIADSGGDACKMYMEILSSWEQYPYSNIQKNQFQRLGGPCTYSMEAVINLLDMQFK